MKNILFAAVIVGLVVWGFRAAVKVDEDRDAKIVAACIDTGCSEAKCEGLVAMGRGKLECSGGVLDITTKDKPMSHRKTVMDYTIADVHAQRKAADIFGVLAFVIAAIILWIVI